MRHSQRANEQLLQVWVICEDDGAINSAHCTCMAGLGEVCSHVSAILFYLESAYRVTKTCTQIDCRWKEPRLIETIPYARIMDITFTKPKSSISCNRKRGAHFYNDAVPFAGLPQPSYLLPAEASLQPESSSIMILESSFVDVEPSIVETEPSPVTARTQEVLPTELPPMDCMDDKEPSSAEISSVVEPELTSVVKLELSSVETEPSLANTETQGTELPSGNCINDKERSSASFSQLLHCVPTDEEQTAFLTKIAKFKPVISSIISPFSSEFKPTTPVVNLPSSLRDLYQAHNEELTYSELIVVCEQVNLTISREEIAAIEVATLNQTKSMAWFTQRAGRITASVMKNVCATDPGNPAQSLICRVCYPDANKFSSQATKWGCEHESLAKAAYTDIMQNSHSGFVCKDSGFVISSTYPFIGASPDGVISCECCGPGVLEIKCPYCVRNDEPSSAPYLDNSRLSKSHVYFYIPGTDTALCVFCKLCRFCSGYILQ